MKIRIAASVEEKKQILPLLRQKFEEKNGDILKKFLDDKKALLRYANLGGFEYEFATSDNYSCVIINNVHDSWDSWCEENWTVDQYGNEWK
jgi:hypothetical protein